MAETDLVIKFEGKEINVLKNIDKIVKGLDLLEKKSKETTETFQNGAKGITASFLKMTLAIRTQATQISTALAPVSNAFLKVASVVGVTGLTGVVYKSIQASKDFSEELIKISTIVSGDATPVMEQYKKEIIDLSKKSGETTTTLSKGLYKVLTSGVKGTDDAAKAMKFLTLATETADAGLTDVGTAISAMSTVLNAYQKDVSEAGKVSDVLFMTAKEGRISFQQLAYQIGPVANIAARAGVSFEDLAASVVTLAKNGVIGRKAIFSLNGVLEAFMRPSKELNREVRKLGEGFVDAADMLKKKGLIYAMQALNKMAGDNEKNLKILVPGFSNLKAVSILAGQGMDQFVEASKRMHESAGATQEAAAKVDESFSEKWGKFIAKSQALFISIGDKLLPVLIKGLDKISSWMDENGEALANAIAKIAESVASLFTTIVKYGDKVVAVWAAIFAAQKIAAAATALTSFVTAVIRFAPAIAALAPPIAAIAAAAATIGVIAGQVHNRLAEKGPKVASFGGGVRAASPPGAEPAVTQELPLIPITPKGKKPTLPTEDELKKYMALRKEADKYLYDLRVQSLGDEEKLWVKYQDEQEKISKLKFKNDADRKSALALLEQKFIKDLDKYQKEKRQKQADFEQKMRDEGLKGLQEYMDLREKAGIEEQKKRDEAEKYLQDLSLERLDERAKKEIEYQKEVQKIMSMRFENEGDRLTALQLLAEKQKATAEPGFWASVAKGFAERVGQRLYDWALNIADTISSPFQELISSFGQIAAIPFQKLSSIFGGILGGASLADTKKATQEAVAFIQAIVQNLPAALDWFAKEGFPRIMKIFVDNLPTIIDALVRNIPIILDSIIENLDKIIVPLVDGMMRLIPELIKRVPDIIDEIIRMLPDIIDAIIEQIPYIAYELVVAILKVIGKTAKSAVDIGKRTLLGDWSSDTSYFKGQEGIIPNEVPFLGWLHEGGVVDKNLSKMKRAIRAHSGVYVPGGISPGEVPIIGQVGEAVMNAEWVKNMGGKPAVDMMNRTKSVPGPKVTNIVNVQHMFSRDSGDVVDSLMSSTIRQGRGTMKRYVRAGRVPGYAAKA
jgi:TP901 family phage tail tape measure protein